MSDRQRLIWFLAPPALGFIVGLVAEPLTGQIVPGGRIRNASERRAEYYAYVLEKVDTLMSAWRQAWRTGDELQLAEAYAEDALLLLPGGTPVSGRDQVREVLAGVIPGAGEIRTSRVDFDASERLAYQFGDFRFVDRSSGGPLPQEVAGRHLTLFTHESEAWRVRAQFFLPVGLDLPPSWVPRSRLQPSPVTPETLQGDRYQAFLLDAFTRVNSTLALWRSSWRGDDVNGAAAGFTAGAMLILPGEEPLIGRERIRSRLETLLPDAGALQTSILDFAASGDMAYVSGRYFCECGSDAEAGLIGDYVAVLLTEGGDSRIRALVLLANPSG
jgi:uncharacterized protein (TIGR02246 family)